MDSTAIMTEERTGKAVTGTTLKLIAIAAMFIDHFSAILIEGYVNKIYEAAIDLGDGQGLLNTHPEILVWQTIDLILRSIGRFGFPIFAFLLVEGFIHTRSVAKYARNLAIFAIISELPLNLGFASTLFYPGYQNVFFTLLLGLICIWMIDKFAFKHQWPEKLAPLNYLASVLLGAGLGYFFTQTWFMVIVWEFIDIPNYWYCLAGAMITPLVHLIVSRKWDADQKNRYTATALITLVFAAAATIIRSDYSSAGVMTITVMYLFRENKKKAFGLGVLVLTIMSFIEGMAFFMLIPISKYNGERGKTVNKYFFYAFYPVHLTLIYLTGYLLGIVPFALK